MLPPNEPHWQTLERWSPTLFLLGGGGTITHGIVQAIEAFTPVTPPPDVFVAAGHLLALTGLLGLAPTLIDRQPRLGRVGAGLAALAVAAWGVMTVGQLLTAAGIIASLSAALPGVFFLGVIVVTLLAYVLNGGIALRIADRPATDGLLLLVPAALLAFLLVKGILGSVTAADGALIGGGLGLSMLALGFRLRSWPRGTVDPTPGGVTVRG